MIQIGLSALPISPKSRDHIAMSRNWKIEIKVPLCLWLLNAAALTCPLPAAEPPQRAGESSQKRQNPADWGQTAPSADQFSRHDLNQEGGIVEVPGSASFIPWSPTYFDALQMAKRDRKLILIYFTADYCSWCKKLDTQVLSDPKFIAAVEPKFSFYKALLEEGEVHNHQLQDKNQSLSSQFKIDGFPTLIVLNWEEREIARFHYEDGSPEEYAKKLLAVPAFQSQ